VVAYAAVRSTIESLAGIRQKPGPAPNHPLPPGFLKHADEQTVVSIAAVLQAIHRHGLKGKRFTDWGAVAAPRFLGRSSMRSALQRFRAEGAWGISPHLIPHRSLHSLSGTVSQTLKIHGPKFGVGGGPGGAAEAPLVAAGLLMGDNLPGVWVVWSGCNPEPTAELNGHAAAAEVYAVAVAVVGSQPGWQGPRLRVGTAGLDNSFRRNGRSGGENPFTLESLLATLASQGSRPRTVTWQLNNTAWATWEWNGAGTENGW
jgi:hypothetical protein